MKNRAFLLFLIAASPAISSFAQDDDTRNKSFADRLDVTGYVEIAAQWSSSRLGNHYSAPLPDYPGWQLNLPKSCVWATLDCGRGWSFGTQVEFSNEGFVAIMGDGHMGSRPMEWSQCLELSELWVKKSFSDAAALQIGLIGTPVGQQNDNPNQFFGVIRPEDGPGFLPLNNQSPAVSFVGESGAWAYHVMAIPGFVNYDFGNEYWRYGAYGTFSQSIDRLYGGAFRVDNSSVKGLTVGLSGEAGSGRTRVEAEDEAAPARSLQSTIALASLDWNYDDCNMICRGAFQYGYLHNRNNGRKGGTLYGLPATLQGMSFGAEYGYDFFSLSSSLSSSQKFYVFARYDWSQYRNETAPDLMKWTDAHKVSAGVNWWPIDQILVKGECGFGFKDYPSRFFAGVSVAWQH